MPFKVCVGALNFLVLQWLGVRLARRYQKMQTNIRSSHASIGPGGVSLAYQCDVREVPVGWSLVFWVWPLTGWWSEYRHIRWRTALSVVWYALGLAGCIAAALRYGWRAAPIADVWPRVSFALLISWAFFGSRWIARRS